MGTTREPGVSMTNVLVRQLTFPEMDVAAAIQRITRADRLPWLPQFRSQEQAAEVFRTRVFPAWAVWGAIEDGMIKGFIAFKEGWVDRLFVLPQAQRRGLGTALVEVAKTAYPRLQLWTFQRNLPARRFYEARGFVLAEETDGAGNMEREPDARYVWSRE